MAERPPPSPPSPVAIGVAVRSRTGRLVTAVEALPGSVANHDFLVRLDGGARVVVKCGPRDELAAEAWTCRRLRELDAPVPEVLDFAPRDELIGRPALFLDFMAGEPTEDAGAVAECARWMRRVHGQRLPGFGPLVVEPDGSARGRYATWRDAVLARLVSTPALVADGILSRQVAETAYGLVTGGDLLEFDAPGSLMHNDLKPAHLFGRGRDPRSMSAAESIPEPAAAATSTGRLGGARLAAIIDWGDAGVGDPLADLARFSMTGPEAMAAYLEGYELDPAAVSAERLAAYRIVWNLAALGYELRAGGDWFDVYRDRLCADVEFLAGSD